MGQHDDGYQAIIRAVHGRWRRRFLFLVHAFIGFVVLMQVAYVTSQEQSFLNFETGLTETYSYTHYTMVYETLAGQVWLAVLTIHFLYILFAELRDRAVRREIERERKWRILEGLEWAQPELRDRLVRLAEARDGELIDFDAAAWEANVKRKRG